MAFQMRFPFQPIWARKADQLNLDQISDSQVHGGRSAISFPAASDGKTWRFGGVSDVQLGN